MSSPTPEQQLATILAAWNTWRIQSNAAKSDAGVGVAFDDFTDVVEPLAVANGHPSGKPRRRLG